MSRTTQGYLIALTGIVIWSTTGVLIGYLVTHYALPPLLLALWRNLLVCAVLAPTLLLVRRSALRLNAAQLRFFVGYGLVLGIFNSMWVLSVQANGAAVATVLAYSSAGFTALLALWLFQERLGLPKIAAVVLSLVGSILVANAYDPAMWRLNPMGIITGLLSGLLFASYTLLGKEAARRKINAWAAMLYSFAFGALFITVFNLVPFIPGAAGSLPALLPRLPLDGWLVLIFLSVGPTVLGFGLYNTAMNYLQASIANILATLEPAMTAVEAYLFLGERLTLVQIIGSVISLSAVFIVQLERRPEEAPVIEAAGPGPAAT
jgi:drug/metabolite transporter (DMT)-like permease